MESEKETCARITYIVKPRLQYKELQQNRILSVDIKIIPEIGLPDFPILSATLDWQRGLDVWQSECIDPFTWSAVAAQMLLAMKEAKKLIDPVTYCAGEPA